jgi:UDP-N-acetyl-D-mannosaminuronic acid transferase (WecB/TagA/CpsF family)
MFTFKFKRISFYSGSYPEIKNLITKGGYLVAPAASALVNIGEDKQYYKSLLHSDVAILDSGFFCILLRIFKKYKIIKLSGYLFLARFIKEYNNKDKMFLINPSIKEDKINYKYLLNQNIKKVKSYVAPIYKKIDDKELVKKINSFKPKYIIINLGGGVQEPLALYIKNQVNFKTSILCTGAAIAFLTKQQAPINKIVDRVYLGWFVRLLWNPKKNYKRVFDSLKLIRYFLK